jgi:hypothetical protein
MPELILFFMIAVIGGILVLIGSVVLIGRKVTEPKSALQQKIDKLEKEVETLRKSK